MHERTHTYKHTRIKPSLKKLLRNETQPPLAMSLGSEITACFVYFGHRLFTRLPCLPKSVASSIWATLGYFLNCPKGKINYYQCVYYLF